MLCYVGREEGREGRGIFLIWVWVLVVWSRQISIDLLSLSLPSSLSLSLSSLNPYPPSHSPFQGSQLQDHNITQAFKLLSPYICPPSLSLYNRIQDRK